MVPKNRNVENATGTVKNMIPLDLIPLEISAIFPKEIILFVMFLDLLSQRSLQNSFNPKLMGRSLNNLE